MDKHLKLLIIVAIVGAIVACSSPENVPFTEAHNYFVRNDAPMPVPTTITTEEQFGKYFGMAAFMGKDGKPTPIDFTTQFVLPVVLPVTDTETEIQPQKVELQGDTLFYTYVIQTGEQLSFSIQPLSLIILDKQYEDKAIKPIARTVAKQ